MTVFLDRTLLKRKLAGENLLEFETHSDFLFNWSSLLDFLDLGEELFKEIPSFNLENELFSLILSTLSVGAEKEIIQRLYDQIFVECLTHVRALVQIQPTYLLAEINKKKSSLLGKSLTTIERYLKEDPYHAMHDLTLYLAWDRVCVSVAALFEIPFAGLNALEGLAVFKDCLIESFIHIKEQGSTNPSFFRLVEALYAYDLREDRLSIHTEEEWLILCKSAPSLKPRECLLDLYYIDECIGVVGSVSTKNSKAFTVESKEKVEARIALVHFMIKKLKKEIFHWNYEFSPLEIIYVKL